MEENRQFILPRLVKTACGKRMKRNPKDKKYPNGLFDSSLLEQTASNFDPVKPGGIESNAYLRTENPRLLAMKIKSSQKAIPKKTGLRPITASMPDPIQMMPSLLTNKPLSAIKCPDVKGTQIMAKRIDAEKKSLLFKEDPVAYFSKRKDGRGHRFIYLNFAGNRKDPYFSPYDLIKVPSSDVHKEYFTMSANGVTHILPDGNTDNLSLDQWSKEAAIFQTIRKLKTFNQFYFWKPFRKWKNFVMRQRYEQIIDDVYQYSYYNNPGFYATSIDFLRSSPDSIIKQYLLSFQPQKKYQLNEFLELTTTNRELLREEFEKFLDDAISLLTHLNADIRNPERRIVTDSDFPEIKRQNPNLGQLIVLEQKKEYEKTRRNEIVQIEIKAFSEFIRLTDYILLESLARSCYECWQLAEYNVTQDMASIFTIEISFSEDGKVVFSPTFNTLIEAVTQTLDSSLTCLQGLPRLLHATALRQQLRETLGDAVTPLFDNGPTFEQFIECNNNLPAIKKQIISVFQASFKEAEQACQQYLAFFPIFKIKLSWNPNDYIHERGGESDPIDVTLSTDPTEISETHILFDSSKEKIVDFQQIYKDIDTFQEHEEMMAHFRSASDYGALYIDSKQLRTILTPIPTLSLKSLQETLLALTNEKVESITRIFKYCGRRLKKEPNTLERFVDFCDFINRIGKLTDYIKLEIKFVDEMFNLFDTIHVAVEGHTKNPLHSGFYNFKVDQQAAEGLRDLNADKFTFVLQQKLKEKERKIQKYHDSFTSFPDSIQNPEIESLLVNVKKYRGKLINMKTEVENLKHYQEIAHINGNDFALFYQVLQEAEFMENLYESIGKWHKISDFIYKVPMMSLDMPLFITEITDLNENVMKMKETNNNDNLLLSQLEEKSSEIYSYRVELESLFNGRMQTHHWNTLFQICGQPNAYYSQIKIGELIKYNILKEKEKIADITTTSQGESQLEAEFQAISAHWKNVEIPLIESDEEMTADTMTLGSLDQLFKEINESQAYLQNMLQIPFVKCVKDDVISLSVQIQNAAQILEAWQRFQTNWKYISPIFNQDDTKHNLQSLIPKFQMVKKRWSQLVKHTLSNTKLFQVCSFPTLLNLINENNKTLDSIMESLGRYLEIKRQAFPRLYFVSDSELIQMISTLDFSVMSHHITKLFMHIRAVDSQSADKNDIPPSTKTKVTRFSKIKISGFVGEDGDTFVFNHPILCDGMMENWLQKVHDQMIASVKEYLSSSIARFSSSNLSDWIITVPTHIAALTLHVSFTRDIEECFMNFESNSRAFTNYTNQLTDKFKNLKTALANPNDANELMKISNIATLLNFQISQISQFSERFPHYSQRMNWNNRLRAQFDVKSSQLKILFGDNVTEFGFEFYGSNKQLIMTPASEKAMLNILTHINNNNIPFIYGSRGKAHLLDVIASIYGRFLYICPPFIENTGFFNRLLISTANCECWVCFDGLEKQSQNTLSYIYDTLRNVGDLKTPSFDFPKTTKIFMLGNSSFYRTNNEILPQIKTFFKPVAFAAPDLRLITMTKLNVLGFKSLKHSAFKLCNTVNTIVHTFDSLVTKSALIIIMQVIDSAHLLLENIIHSNKITFVNYYEDYTPAEEYAIARALFQQFRYLVPLSQRKVLLEIIYASFQLFDSFQLFEDYVTHPNCLEAEEAEMLIKDALLEIIDTNLYPVSYIIDQVIALYNLMLTRSIIFIAGPQNSGKTTVINYIKECFLKLSQNAEIINRFQGIRPTKIIDVYHETNDEGQMYNSYGKNSQLYSLIHNLMLHEKTHHCILKFNGPITHNFSQHITEMATEKKFCLPTLDTFIFSQKFHIFVETENFSEFSPSLLSIAGVLLMRNLQTTSVSADLKIVPLPNIIFNRAFNYIKPSFDVENIKKVFVSTMPEVTKIIEHLLKESSNGRSLDDVYLNDIMLYNSLIYAFQYMESKNISNDVESVKKLLAFSFFTIYSSVVNQRYQINDLNDKLLQLFDVKVPNDWSGIEPQRHFVEMYPKPTLRSTMLYKNEFVPLTISKLNEKPITAKDEIPTLHTDAFIYSANLLPALHEIPILLQSNSHIFLHAPKREGKTSFLQLMFRENPDYQPIYVNVSPTMTSKWLLDFLDSHTITTVKEYIMMSRAQRYIYVFEDVTPSNMKVIEIIRMIVESAYIPQTMKNDPNFYDITKLSSFAVLVTSSNTIFEFPKRFASHFVPITLPEMSPETKHHIFHAKASLLGVAGSPTEKAYDTVKQRDFDVMRLLDVLPKVKTEIETNGVIKFDERLLINQEFEDSDDIFLPELLINDDGEYIVKAEQINFNKLAEALETKYLNLINSARCPISLKFYRPVMYKWACLQRAICCPGGSCLLQGNEGSGRFSLARLTAFTSSYDFYNLNEKNFDAKIAKAITKCATTKKHCIVFLRDQECTHSSVKRLLYLLKNHEFLYFFNEEASEKLYTTFLNIKDLNPQNRIIGHRAIMEILKVCFHAVIAVSPQFKTNHYPHLLTIKSDIADNKNYLEMCAKDAFQGNENIPADYSSIFSTIYKKYGTCQNQYFDFLDIFTINFLNEEKAMMNRSIDKKLSIEFLNKTRILKKEIEKKILELSPKLEKCKKENEELKAVLNAKQEEIDNAMKKFNDEEAVFLNQNEELRSQIQELGEELADELTEVDKERDKLASLKNEDIECLKVLADSPPDRLVSLVQILCTYLEIPFDYETTGKEFLVSPTFLDRIKTDIDHLNIKDDILLMTNPIFDDKKFEIKDFVSIAPPAVTIFLWIKAVNIYANTVMKINHAKQEIENNNQQLEELRKKNAPEKENIHKMQIEFEEEKIKMENKISELEKVFEDNEELNEKSNLIAKILDNIDEFEGKLKEKEQHANVASEVLLYSAFIAFCGSYNQEKRDEFQKFVIKLTKNYLIDPKVFIPLKLALNDPLPSDNIDSKQTISYHTEIEGRLILSSIRPPLIHDQDHLILPFLQTRFEHLQIYSALMPNLIDRLLIALHDGSPMILTDVCDLSDELDFVFRVLKSKPEKAMWEDQMIAVSPKFRLFLFTHEKELPERILNRVCLINVSLSSSITTDELILRSFANRYSPKVLSLLPKVRKADSEKILSVIKNEMILMKSFSDIMNKDDGMLDNKEKIEEILKAKEAINESKKPIEDFDEINKEIDELTKPYQQTVTMCEKLWRSFSRYLPSSKLITFKMFIDMVESCFSNQTDIIPNLLKKLLPLVSIQNAYSLLFLTSIHDREDRNEILENIATRYYNKAILEDKAKVEENFVEALKNDNNILHFFEFYFKSITESFGDVQYPPFLIDSFSATNMVIIQCSRVSDPIPLLQQFMIMRNRNDSYVMFTLSEDLSNSNQISQMISHGFWVALIYNTPSIKIAGFISDLVSHATSATKLILIAQSIEYIPDNLINRASLFYFNDFASIRLQMMQIFQHYQNSIRSSVDPTLMKKMVYIISLLYSLINFRDFISPIGFTEFNMIPEIYMKEIIDSLRSVIDSDHHELFSRNLRDYLFDTAFGGNCLDTFDRRKLRLHIYQVFSKIDNVQFVDSTSNEEQVWAVPPDAPIGNYVHFFEKYPIVTTTDILLMDRKIASYFENWNLGRLFIKPFFSLAGIKNNDTEIINVAVPSTIQIRIDSKMNTAEGLVVRNEINLFNQVIVEMKNTKTTRKVPERWKELAGYSESGDMVEFVQFLQHKKNQLEKMPCQEIDVRYFRDLKGLLLAHMHDYALKFNQTVDVIDYEFRSGPPGLMSLLLKNLVLVGAKYESGIISPTKERSVPFTTLPPLYANITAKTPRAQKTFMCPMFRNLPSAEFALSSDLKRTDGDTDNFIWYMPTKTSANDKYLVANSVSIVCQVPNVFSIV
ncbi:Dynein heavy chain family protein [Tritrichomonas foetus]|uniref:Dynein heavy chain family protein n=1 Tax=Tritrichomonas foetus TaxID=1144522 RepID=A0A1J4JX17_9EUKA|nr:Dynein heavy chain family protein [Tritrichomonas foetus]|eukprot:OHT02076.1 Dynein heavy chain family protein [Tritrichomonas foetus]